MLVVHYERSAEMVFLVADAMKQSQCRATINFSFRELLGEACWRHDQVRKARRPRLIGGLLNRVR